jgi:predicted ABC-type ATPase
VVRVLVAGINGAGKSTFAQDRKTIREFCGLTGTSDDIEIINPDIITKKLLQTELDLSLDDANKRAADLCEERVRHLVDVGSHSFVIETVLSTNKYKAIVKKAQERGFRFLLSMSFSPPWRRQWPVLPCGCLAAATMSRQTR